jgi:hypothetical protein
MKKYLLAFISCCGLLFSCENDVQEVKDLGKRNPGIEEGKSIESFLSTDGKVKAKLIAPVLFRYTNDSGKIEFPKSLHVDFYDTLATVESQMNAKYGKYLENDNKVFLRDSVIVFNRHRDTLWCDELWWDQLTGTFYTDKPATIYKYGQQKIKGQMGLVADQNFKWFTLNKVGRVNTGTDNFINVPDSSY